MEQNLRPARPVSPGRILRQELEARGWTQRDLAAILGRPEQMVSEIINGAKQITPETSLELAQAFGVSPEFWYTLEANYRLELARRQARDDTIARRSQLYTAFPLQEMARRGWLALCESVDALEAEVSRFFGLDLSALPEVLTVAVRFRCSTTRGPATYAQLAWLRRAEQLARQQTVTGWQPEHVQPLVADLAALTMCAEDAARVPQVLARWGVRCVFLRHLSKTYLDGAVFYLDGEPCVALTLRYDRIDSFWFTLLHEIGHLAEGGQASYLDVLEDSHGEAGGIEPGGEETDSHEAWANQMASQWLITPDAFRDFVSVTRPRFSEAHIEAFAAGQRRHPGIVLGRLQRDRLIPYKNLRGLLVKVSPYLKDYIQG
jgi:HTH-type transcriptional regulator/antitoxin HigA